MVPPKGRVITYTYARSDKDTTLHKELVKRVVKIEYGDGQVEYFTYGSHGEELGHVNVNGFVIDVDAKKGFEQAQKDYQKARQAKNQAEDEASHEAGGGGQ